MSKASIRCVDDFDVFNVGLLARSVSGTDTTYSENLSDIHGNVVLMQNIGGSVFKHPLVGYHNGMGYNGVGVPSHYWGENTTYDFTVSANVAPGYKMVDLKFFGIEHDDNTGSEDSIKTWWTNEHPYGFKIDRWFR